MCKTTCPNGYAANLSTRVCDLVVIDPYRVDFYDKIILGSIESMQVGITSTTVYPTYDTNDPFPAKSVATTLLQPVL